jgi:hypothetical protein
MLRGRGASNTTPTGKIGSRSHSTGRTRAKPTYGAYQVGPRPRNLKEIDVYLRQDRPRDMKPIHNRNRRRHFQEKNQIQIYPDRNYIVGGSRRGLNARQAAMDAKLPIYTGAKAP